MAKNDNRTKIVFDYEGKEYTLVFSAASLKKMERNYGVKFAQLDEYVITGAEDLFVGAFIENHNEVPRAKREEIFRVLKANAEDGEATIGEALISMLTEAIEELKPKGNVAWKVSKKA